MRSIIGISIFITICVICLACASLPRREYVEKEMTLSTDKTEYVAPWKVDDYVRSIMENAKGYTEPTNNVNEWLGWVYVSISGVMFVVGFALFGIAYLTHQYKCNYLGFLSLIGAGVAAGFAEFVDWWWTIPVTAVIGILIWFLTHKNKSFSLYNWFCRER